MQEVPLEEKKGLASLSEDAIEHDIRKLFYSNYINFVDALANEVKGTKDEQVTINEIAMLKNRKTFDDHSTKRLSLDGFHKLLIDKKIDIDHELVNKVFYEALWNVSSLGIFEMASRTHLLEKVHEDEDISAKMQGMLKTRINAVIFGDIIQVEILKFNSLQIAIVINKVAWYAVHLVSMTMTTESCDILIYASHHRLDGFFLKAKALEYAAKINKQIQETFKNRELDSFVSMIGLRKFFEFFALYSLPKQVLSNPDRFLEPFDVALVDRGKYFHVAIYLGDDKVTHIYDASSAYGDKSKQGGVKERGILAISSPWDVFVSSSTKLYRYLSFLPKGNPKSIQDRILQFKTMEVNGKYKYNLLNNNCEYAATYCVYGVAFCKQPFASLNGHFIVVKGGNSQVL